MRLRVTAIFALCCIGLAFPLSAAEQDKHRKKADKQWHSENPLGFTGKDAKKQYKQAQKREKKRKKDAARLAKEEDKYDRKMKAAVEKAAQDQEKK